MICTFYSYKGGVGRTVALANLAELFYQAGLRVVMIDWDLSAPGLESYFPTLDLPTTCEQPGLIDMLWHYKEYMSYAPANDGPLTLESPARYLIPVYDDGFAPGSLYLLTAGRRPSAEPLAYQKAVLTFDWQEFYDIWEGEQYFTWLRQQLTELADIVLIDCRAGFSEMGNVCTYHLADVVLLLCGPDTQNLQGTYEMAQRFTARQVRQVRAEQPLQVIVVPSRIDEQTGDAEVLRCKYEFVRRFNAQNFATAADLITTGEAMWGLRIPQAPATALLDPLPARQPPHERHTGLCQAYRRLVEVIALRSPAHARLRQFIKVHVLHNQPVIAEHNEPSADHRLPELYRLPLEALVKTCAEVYLRPTPGYINKPAQEAIRLEPGIYAKIVDGPQVVDGLRWWQIVCKVGDNQQPQLLSSATTFTALKVPVVRGWVAEKTPGGSEQLQRIDLEPFSSEAQPLLGDGNN